MGWNVAQREEEGSCSSQFPKEEERKGLMYVDCWDVFDAVDDLPAVVPEESRNASAAETDRVFLKESGFPSDND